jgi:sodium/proline symporter
MLSSLGWGLGYFGQPHILCRFMAIRSPSEIPVARRIAMVWVTLSMAGALLAGLAGVGVFAENPLVEVDVETVFIRLVQVFLHPVPAGICLAAVLAAIMSTADSQLLVSSSVLAEDFYKQVVHKNADQKHLVRVGRGAVILIALVAAVLALDPDSMVLALVAYAWAGFGATFGPILILSLFWKGVTRGGALAGIVVGGLTVIVWRNLRGGIFDLYEIIPGFVLSLLAIAIVSGVSKPSRPGPPA